MKINITLNAEHASFNQSDVQRPNHEYVLIADIPKALSLMEGETARVQTQVIISGGDRDVIAIVNMGAGEAGGEIDPMRGQFFIPDMHEMTRIEVDVVNRTGSILIIQPGVGIGLMNLRPIRTFEDARDSVDSGSPEFDRSGYDRQEIEITLGAVPVQAVFNPKHIDPKLAPTYATDGAAAFDLRADVAERLVLAPGERRPIGTGLSMAIPQGFEGQVRPRSGLAYKNGITVTNSPGTIDSDYRGEIVVILHNLGAEPFEVAPEDRIAQMLIAPVARAVLEYADSLDETARGAGGFGSTGRN